MRPDAVRWLRPVHPDERKFDPDQPRDEDGRWTDDSGQADAGNLSAAHSDEGSPASATIIKEETCDAQYRLDTFKCNLVRTLSCWRQAAERYGACLAGRPIPPFNF